MSNYNKDGICAFRIGETGSLPIPCEPDPNAKSVSMEVTQVTPTTITVRIKPEEGP